MKRRKQIAKALGLAAITALALSGIVASAAQAAPKWFINLAAFHDTELIDGEGKAELLVEGIGLELGCEKVRFGGIIEKLEHGLGTAQFEECTVLGAAAVCQVEPITAFLLILGFLHDGKTYVLLLQPVTAESMMRVTIVGEECAVAMENEELIGSTVASVPAAEGLIQTWNVLPRAELESLFPEHELRFGESMAVLDMSMPLVLTGPKAGKKWGLK